VPTISNQVDYREFCHFSSTIGTRHFYVAALHGYNVTDATQIPHTSPFTPGTAISFPDNKTCTAYANFMVPTDYLRSMTITAVMTPFTAAAGNIWGSPEAYFGECGESAITHPFAPGYSAAAITDGTDWNCVHTLAITDGVVGAADLCALRYDRAGANANDTVNNTVHFFGWIVEYVAKS